jgi:hypothetical protein
VYIIVLLSIVDGGNSILVSGAILNAANFDCPLISKRVSNVSRHAHALDGCYFREVKDVVKNGGTHYRVRTTKEHSTIC